MPLTDISSSDDLRPEERYHKTPLLEVFEGFLTLRDAVLPALKRDPSLTMDSLREHGEAADGMRSSPQCVYAAFFGHDCIRLGRSTADDQYTVEDGRHRIHVARALGWRGVPARARTAR